MENSFSFSENIHSTYSVLRDSTEGQYKYICVKVAEIIKKTSPCLGLEFHLSDISAQHELPELIRCG